MSPRAEPSAPLPGAAAGRADLIRCAAQGDDDCLIRLAALFGYEEPPRAPQRSAPSGIESCAADRTTITTDPAPSPQRQQALIERQVIAPLPEPDAGNQEIPPVEGESTVERLGPPPPLVPWARLWPFLRAALGETVERNRVDLARLVAAAARLRPPRRLPRLKGRRWAPCAHLLLDLSPRLYPFWNDFHDLKDQLVRLRGLTGLEVLRLDQGPDGLVQSWTRGPGPAAWGPGRPYVPPPWGAPVVIAGDLGCLGTKARRADWEGFGRRIIGRRRPVALTPCPPRWWDPVLAGLFFPVFLDRNAQLPPRAAGPRPWPTAPVDLAAVLREDQGAQRLLTLLSACIAIRPGLLRHLRHRLPAHLADAGSEAAAWQHPAFTAGDFALLPGDLTELGRLRAAFPTTGDEDERRLAWALIRAQQGQGSTRSQRMEERALQAAAHGRTDPEAEAFYQEVAAALTEAAAEGEHARWLGAWITSHAGHLDRAAWDHSPSSHRLWLLAHPEAERSGSVNPAGFDIYRAQAAVGRPKQPHSWRLVQRGDWLEWEPTAAPAETFGSGSPVVEQMPTGWPVVDAQEARAGAPWQSLGLDPANGGAGALPLAAAGWRLRTDFEELLIAPMDRPAWAHTLGRDGEGLFVGFTDGHGERRAYWCAPLEWLRWPGSLVRPALESPWDGHGCFIDEGQYRALRSLGLALGRGGRTLSRDRLGLRLEIAIKGVPIGLRWVWPGVFQMGSPRTEKGRDNDERQHEVILTRGFWLAETACTQALWEAVMGENPSHAKEPQRPVEQVSWEQVQGFIERLNAELAASLGAPVDPALPDAAESSAQRTLRFRLPTEAEWEYACRAGTMTAYSFGDDFDPKLANNGRETVAVRSLPPNPWGFYEMHGNVDEWCQDWFGDYPTGPVVDPEGAASGGRRVLRGGGWAGGARYLRSACRYLHDPGDRLHDGGFRLALGPEPGQAGNGTEAGSGAGLPAQGASASERKARAVRSRGAEGGKGA